MLATMVAGFSLLAHAGPSAAQVALRTVTNSHAGADEGTIAAGKFRLRYRIEGTGHPTIVIGSAIYYPRVFSRNLRRHLRLVFLDHRGFAASPGKVDRTEFGLDTLVDDVEAARQRLGLEQIAVIGHSGHAYIALEYAKKYPARVSHVVLIAAAPDLGVANAAAAERYWQESVSPERKAALNDNMSSMPEQRLEKLAPGERLVKSYLRIGPRAWYDFRFDASPLWAGVELNAEIYQFLWEEVFREIDITKGLASFDRPVFLALGRYDFIVAPACSWDPIRPRFKDLTVRVFERSGHSPPFEEPELFDAELLRFIARHP